MGKMTLRHDDIDFRFRCAVFFVIKSIALHLLYFVYFVVSHISINNQFRNWVKLTASMGEEDMQLQHKLVCLIFSIVKSTSTQSWIKQIATVSFVLQEFFAEITNINRQLTEFEQKQVRLNKGSYCCEWTLKPYHYAEQHQKNSGILRINACCKNRKICLGTQKQRHKMYGTCQGKRIGLKKEIKELEMTEHVCSRKYVCFTKGTFQFG